MIVSLVLGQATSLSKRGKTVDRSSTRIMMSFLIVSEDTKLRWLSAGRADGEDVGNGIDHQADDLIALGDHDDDATP